MTNVIRPDDMRRQNRAKILTTLRPNRQLSRIEISQETHLSAATVSAITGDLIEEKILIRSDVVQSESHENSSTGVRGRPRVALSHNPQYTYIVALVLKLNRIMATIFDYRGNAISEAQLDPPTTTCSSNLLLDEMADAISKCLEDADLKPENLQQICVGVQGTTDVDGTMLLWSPITKETKIPVKAFLENMFGAHASVHNDCNMMASALKSMLPATYNTDFAAILLSRGIGMGLYHNGELVIGKQSSAAEFGHMTHILDGAQCRCGRLGCIEAYAGDYAIVRNAQEIDENIAPQESIAKEDLDGIFKRANSGEPLALLAVEKACHAIATGIASLFALFDPFPIALIGTRSNADELLTRLITSSLMKINPQLTQKDISLQFFHEENPLTLKGCAFTALSQIDQFANNASLQTNGKLQSAAR